MKKPVKPESPRLNSIEPSKTLNKYVGSFSCENFQSLEDFNKQIHEYLISFDINESNNQNIKIDFTVNDGSSYCGIYILKEKPQALYNKELATFNIGVEIYNNKMIKYNKDLKAYKLDLAKQLTEKNK